MSNVKLMNHCVLVCIFVAPVTACCHFLSDRSYALSFPWFCSNRSDYSCTAKCLMQCQFMVVIHMAILLFLSYVLLACLNCALAF
uniref:Uncharacterized protein n=1 Tax=Arundo donax TaxID=35708 RepID=A0A0A9FX32_ARUDO